MSFFHIPDLFPDRDRVIFLPTPYNGCVVFDPPEHRNVRLGLYRSAGQGVPPGVRLIIVDHSVVDHRCRAVGVDDRGRVDIAHPDTTVIIHSVEIVARDDDGPAGIGITIDIEIDPGDVVGIQPVMGASPAAVTVVGLAWPQWHPPDIPVMVNPRHSSGRPEKTDVQQGKPRPSACHRRCPIPRILDIHPVAVMMRDVTERLCRNPHLVSMPVGPAAGGEGRPPGGDGGGPPEPAR